MPDTVSLPRSSPEQQGIASRSILRFLDEANSQIDSLHSLMILRYGNVVAEGWWQPYAPEHPHILFSLSKSFTSTAAGFAVSEGLITLDDPVISFFPDDLPETISDNLRAMRVRDILAMASGIGQDTVRKFEDPYHWVRSFLRFPVPYEPGTYFAYDSGATYMVSAILNKVTGQSLLEYLEPRLLAPLGITGATWETCPSGIQVGGWGLRLKTEDIAKFGQLYLQDGVWEGKQLLPAGWVETATTRHVSNGTDPDSDWAQGYGFQFWRCRHNAYRGDGAFGQYCVVMPEKDAVIAITSGVGDLQAVLNLIWKHLLPAMEDAELLANPNAEQELRERLASLTIKSPTGEMTSPIAASVSGTTYILEPNHADLETIRFDFGDTTTLTLTTVQGESILRCGTHGAWGMGDGAAKLVDASIVSFCETPLPAIAASGAWVTPTTFAATLCFYETPFIVALRCRFEGDRLFLETKQNVSFGSTDPKQIQGSRR